LNVTTTEKLKVNFSYQSTVNIATHEVILVLLLACATSRLAPKQMKTKNIIFMGANFKSVFFHYHRL
jgi:hypothetical protein